MDKRDKMVVFIGFLILVIAIIGVMYEEKGYTEAGKKEEKITYAVDWEEETTSFQESGTVMKGEETTLTYSIDQEGLIEVEFRLEWSDNLARGFLIPWNWSDIIDMKIDAPGSVEFSSNPVSGYKSPLVVKAKVGDIPSTMTINATNETEAWNIVSSYITKNGMGDWNAHISIKTKPFFFDRGNDFTLFITYKYYSPTLREISE
ncbi:MAG: hypothetical protein FE048_04095 [Thermoplasmata archaeon]|nr:MAG: hypothetical protein FE048_04095 [Thermoplasmata archaeon]